MGAFGAMVVTAEFPWLLAGTVERDFLTRVRPLFSDFPVLPRGIWTSEMFAFCVWCEKFGVRQAIESGVYAGQSTFVLTRWFAPDGALWSIDHDAEARWRADKVLKHSQPHSFWEFRPGYAELYVPAILDQFLSGAPTALLIDGPKGEPAIRLALDMLARYPHVAFAAIHDLYRPVPPRENSARTMLDGLPNTWASDDPAFVERFRYLDGENHARWLDETGHGKLPYRYLGQSEEFSMKSYGNTLGFIFR